MLLKVTGSVADSGGRLVADDDYVPLSFQTSEATLASPYLWFAQTPFKALEIKADRDSKVVAAIILVVASHKRRGKRQDRIGLFAGAGDIVGVGFFGLTDAELGNVERLIPG